MNRKYKCLADVPNDVLAKRLNELALAVAGGKDTMSEEFSMRIPAELDRDADIVLSLSSTRIKSLEKRNAELTEALAFLFREADVTHRYVTSAGHGGVTPLLSDAIEKARKALNPSPRED